MITWGCGSNCQQSVLVDLRNGQIYDAPDTDQGMSYRLTSRLLITDYTDGEGKEPYVVNSVHPVPAFYLWTGSEFHKLD